MPDERLNDIIALLGCAPLKPTDVVLDIGIGSGQITQEIAKRVFKVVGTGVAIDSYHTNRGALRNAGILPVECKIERLPFPAESFDVVLMSHVLEHCLNVGFALSEARRVLKPEGLLCIFAPPHEPLVRGGHVSIGWHIGQLMYVLILAGFNAAQGHFAKRGYNVCAFVRKEHRVLPKLRFDFGDIATLSDDGRFPLPIINHDPGWEGFFGDLQAVNWPWIEILDIRRPGPRSKIILCLIPAFLRPKVRSFLARAQRTLAETSDDYQELTNPTVLHK